MDMGKKLTTSNHPDSQWVTKNSSDKPQNEEIIQKVDKIKRLIERDNNIKQTLHEQSIRYERRHFQGIPSVGC